VTAPLIGITMSRDYKMGRYWLPVDYCRRVIEAGGHPLLLSPLPEGAAIDLLPRIQGLILSGGVDIAPFCYAEEPKPGLGEVDPERDRWEINLVREALSLDLPLLGICRGLQLIIVAAGGALIQHLSGPEYLQHFQRAPRSSGSHTVTVTPHTRLAALAGKDKITVNSFHHQAALAPEPGWQLSAVSADGVIEAVEHPGKRFALAVQWHPETLEHPTSAALFLAFLHSAV